jgi:protein ImuB
MVVCVLLPRFALLAALRAWSEEGRASHELGGEPPASLLSEPVALGPPPGGVQTVGDASPAAEAFGVLAGMRMGEALARCPELRLVPPDPDAVRAGWGKVLDRLERIGAAPESDRAGEAYFESDGLRGIHGGHLEGVLEATRRSLGRRVRLGAAPSRFAAYAAALRARRRGGARIVPAGAVRAFLAPLEVGVLRARQELAELPDVLERLGIRTLGELSELPAPAVAERFGHPGLLALDLAHGRDTPLAPRRPPEPVVERLDLPEAASGMQLERALALLVARVLARPERRGRSLRALVLTARFVEGGTWRAHATLRRASADPERLRLALAPRLGELPAPAESLAVEVEAFGPPAQDQERLVHDEDSAAAERRARLGEAVRQVRAVAGEGAALRALEVDPGSRVPERRTVLAPFPAEETSGRRGGTRAGPGPTVAGTSMTPDVRRLGNPPGAAK